MKKAGSLLGHGRWIVISVLLTGSLIQLIAVYYFKKSQGYDFISSFAQALIIGGLIGLILQTAEFARYFERRLAEVLIQDKYLELLNHSKLQEVGVAALQKTIESEVTNPENKWRDFYEVFCRELFPLLKGCYRADYDEIVELEFVESNSIDSSIKEGCKAAHKWGITRYDLVAPSAEVEEQHEVKWEVVLRKVPNLPAEKHYRVELSVDGKEIPLEGKIEITEKGAEVFIELAYSFTFKKKAHIELKTHEYEKAESFGFVSMGMKYLTYNFKLTFSSFEPLVFDAEVFGLKVQGTPPDIARSVVTCSYPGWMLPGHGYFMMWNKE